MARCLVTGGAGFIGSHVAEKLIAEGHEVVVIDNLSLGKAEYVPSEAVFHEVDIRDFATIEPFFRGVDAVFHLAAEPRLPLSIEDPIGTHAVNVTGTLHVLEASRRAGVGKFIFTSTCAIFGDETLPIGESATPCPKSPYGLHKLMGEGYVNLYCRLYGLKAVTLRYFNVFGPRKTAEGGYPMVIPVFLRQKKNGEPLTIVGDGEQTRDYVHVYDVVKANILAWQSDVVDGRPFHIGSGRETSVNEIAALIGGPTTNIPERVGEIRRIQADITQAKKILGFEPSVTLEEGIDNLKKEWGVS